MSYARWSEQGSDLYVYFGAQGRYVCCACPLAGATDPDHAEFDSTAAMVAHVRAHQAAGHVVPDRTIPELERDAAENDAFINGPRMEW